MMKKIRDKKGVMKNDSAFQPSLEKEGRRTGLSSFPGIPAACVVNKSRYLAVMFFLLLLSLNIFAQDDPLTRKITGTFSDITIKEALVKIRNKADISFAYNDNLKELSRKTDLRFEDKTVKEVLDGIFGPASLTYRRVGRNITIYRSEGRKHKVTVSGYVFDAKTGEALIQCNVYEKSSMTGVVTNNFGYFSLTLPDVNGEKTVVFSYLGYKNAEVRVGNEDVVLNIRLEPASTGLTEVTVQAERNNKEVLSSSLGKISVKAVEINALPAIAGETDVLKAITLLPGIKQGVDGSSGFYVRGGGPDQNLILLDGVPIYNPYHLWGFLSTFNADAINNIEITKGAFPARYGGRLSSVLDITMKDGNSLKWDKDVTVGLLSAKFLVSGPIKKDVSSIMISARRTYADLLYMPIYRIQNSEKDNVEKRGYNFTDINLKYNYKFSGKDRMYVSAYFSRDKYFDSQKYKEPSDAGENEEEQKRDEGWGNITASARWNHLFGQKVFMNTTVYFSGYNYYTKDFYKYDSKDPDEIPNKENSVEYSSRIEDITVKQDYQYSPSDKHDIRFGAGSIFHYFKPGVSVYASETGKETIENTLKDNDIRATELSAYIEDDFDLSRVIKLNAGIHVSDFLVDGTSYFSFQPRISARILLAKNTSFKLGYAQMTQYIHMLTSSGIVQSSDLWVPSTKNVKPQQAEQYSAGISTLFKNIYLMEIEGYYKKMDNLIEYKDGASFMDNSTSWEDKVASGTGDSYGVEFFLKKKSGRLTGWLGYTLSWTNRKFDEINFGREFPFRYDRRHDVSIVAMYKFNERWSINGTWVYYTGNAVSVPTYSYAAPGYDGNFHSWSSFPTPNSTTGSDISSSGIIESYESRNNYRLPAYHRLDVSAAYSWIRPKASHVLTVGITNLYNKMNPSFYYTGHYQDVDTGESQVVYTKVTLFPILPVLSYKVSF